MQVTPTPSIYFLPSYLIPEIRGSEKDQKRAALLGFVVFTQFAVWENEGKLFLFILPRVTYFCCGLGMEGRSQSVGKHGFPLMLSTYMVLTEIENISK